MPDPALRIWIYLLLTAKRQPEDGFQPGQRPVSYRQLRRQTGYGFGTIRRALDWLKGSGYITFEPQDGKPLLIAFPTWAKFQGATEPVAPGGQSVTQPEAPINSDQKPVLRMRKHSASNAEALAGDHWDPDQEETDQEQRDRDPPISPPKGGKSDDYPAEFEAFWAIYPRKHAKKAALKCWQARRRSGISAEDLTTAATHYAAIRNGDDPRYTMHPSTFLGPNDRWRDYLEPPATETPARAVPKPQTSRALASLQHWMHKGADKT